ncbi:MAG: PTS sugar transporter subunit IIA [Planctomycetes bacterium]|nr:PTS sugar transporter subunit IIA [Planctomycetota bacterium]
MKFSDFVCLNAVVNKLQATERNAVINELVQSLVNAGKLDADDAPKIVKAVTKRENEASTGIGKGVALPHVKIKAQKNIVAAIGISDVGIDFQALDKLPVYSVILIVSPDAEPDEHLQVMEYVFKNLQNEKFRKFLRRSETREQIDDLLKEADEGVYC